MEYLIGVDIGTSGTKTVLFDIFGNTVCSKTAEYPLYQPQNGWAEQDALDWFNAAVTTIKSVINESGVSADSIKGVGLSGQMHGLVMLDENNKPLRNSIIWCDQRTSKECAEITTAVGAEKLLEISANPALTGFTASKIMWVKNNEPDIYEKCRHILLPKDYIRLMLTGEYATDVSDASGMQLLDVKGRRWSDYILDALSINPSYLGRVYESCEVTGEITKEAAKLTGLKAGTPVVGGAGDNAAAAVGVGVVKEGAAFVTLGSSGVVFAHTDKPDIDLSGRVHTFCCAVPGAWHVMGVTQAAGLSLKWFRDNFCHSEIEIAANLSKDPYHIMTKQAEKSPVGANRLIYLPYLMGERTPHLDPDARGVFFGLSAMHTKKDLIRAVMEGVSYSQKDSLLVLNEMGINPSFMIACGGGGTSPMWRQMLADVFNLPVKTVKSEEGPALGAAILAGVGCGIYKSVEDGCEKAVKTNEAQNACDENSKKYEMVYKVYKGLYNNVKESYKKLLTIES